MKIRSRHRVDQAYRWRHYVLLILMLCLFISLFFRLVDLTILERPFLQAQSEQRVLHRTLIPGPRGRILDVQGVPLAMSTAMSTVWINPQHWRATAQQMSVVSKLLGHSTAWLKQRTRQIHKRFVYLKRSVDPSLANQLAMLKIVGLNFSIGVSSSLSLGSSDGACHIGFADIDDHGQEGLELALDQWLRGVPGMQLVERDLHSNVIGVREVHQSAQPGRTVQVTLNHQLQYTVYRHLSAAVQRSKAAWGSAIVLDPKTGHVLAMVNFPTFDPNQINARQPAHIRNHAVVDAFEPGSTMKTLTLVALLKAGFQPWSQVDVGAGTLKLQGHMIHDEVKHLGRITLKEVVRKSSNVGIAKLALKVPAEHLHHVFEQLGLGHVTSSGFPGESSGQLHRLTRSGGFDHAAMAYGYGVSVTLLQLAHAYAILANGGIDPGVHFVRTSHDLKQRVMPERMAQQVMQVLQHVTEKGGSGFRAHVAGIHVAGKTGTALIAGPTGYQTDAVNASFVGIAPVQHPQLVVAIVLHKPGPGWHFGGVAAAPVFSQIVAESLPLLKWQIG